MGSFQQFSVFASVAVLHSGRLWTYFQALDQGDKATLAYYNYKLRPYKILQNLVSQIDLKNLKKSLDQIN
jgi:hypothetical protein